MIFDEELEDFLDDEIELSFNELSVVDDGAREKLAELLRGDIVNLDESYFDGVTEIRDYAFANCISLKNIVIGKLVNSIQTLAFQNCTAIETFELLCTTPPSLNANAFNGAKIGRIIVPKGTLEAYKVAQYWGIYADIMEERQ